MAIYVSIVRFYLPMGISCLQRAVMVQSSHGTSAVESVYVLLGRYVAGRTVLTVLICHQMGNLLLVLVSCGKRYFGKSVQEKLVGDFNIPVANLIVLLFHLTSSLH